MIDLKTGSYELAQAASDQDKEYYFVKLTDSALRAIELYQRNNGAHSAPTIQFMGNNGIISFASGGQQFKFSIDEMDGSFQCIKQTGNHLNVEGVMPNRMRIHANEDVFETTKLRMAVAEETVKSKSVREIKPNQKGIGRKVKIESLSTSEKSQFRLPNTSSVPSSSVGRKNASQSPGYQLQFSPRPAISPLHSDSNDSMPVSPAADSDAKSLSASKPIAGTRHMASKSTNNSKSRNSSDKEKTQKGSSPKGIDITKRKLRDRLIHLLAYKPFKKPELYARLQREGIRDKEKSAIGVILKEISTLKDNAFNLKHHIWTSVEEDWPFYDDEDLQTLKQRKSQALKPTSNSTSVVSGPSKTRSTLQITKTEGSPFNSISNTNRDNVLANRESNFGKNQSSDGPVTKKQRISHFKRGDEMLFDSNQAVCDRSQIAPKGEHSHSSDIAKASHTSKGMEVNHGTKTGHNRKLDDNASRPPKLTNKSSEVTESKSQRSTKHDIARAASSSRNRDSSGITESRSIRPTDYSTSNYDQTKTNNNENIQPKSRTPASLPKYDFIEMPKISSIEQRRVYKTEFERNYAEYRELEEAKDRISKRFKKLALRLEENKQNPTAYEEIRQKIVKEYERTNNDPKHKERKARHDYLHAKLAHIKALVDEFDQILRSSMNNEGMVSSS